MIPVRKNESLHIKRAVLTQDERRFPQVASNPTGFRIRKRNLHPSLGGHFPLGDCISTLPVLTVHFVTRFGSPKDMSLCGGGRLRPPRDPSKARVACACGG